jgi:hypothetical protein
MDTTTKQPPVSNTLKGKITHIVNAPPYEIVTITLDPNVTHEITVAYIAVPGGPKLVASSDPSGPRILAATASATTGSGSSGGGSTDVTVTIPVPTAVITSSN